MKAPVIIFLATVACNGIPGATEVIAAPFGVTAPAGAAAGDGDSSTLEPFSSFSGSSGRYQQVYLPWAFTGVGGGAIAFWIESIAFRLDNTNGMSFANTWLDIQVNLSTTTRGPDGLSTVFAENIGADDSVVYPRGELSLSSDYVPGSRYQSDNILIQFSQPFYYDTNHGNLLLDIRNYRFPTDPFRFPPVLDAFSRSGDDVSRVWANSVSAESGVADTLGLASLFNVTPIPEPAASMLLLSGTALTALFLRRQSRHRRMT